MTDYAFIDSTVTHINTPLICSGLGQHHTRGGPAFADILLRSSNAATAARAKAPPNAITLGVLSGRGKLKGNFIPITAQLFGDELAQPCGCPLPHFRTRNPHSHRIIMMNMNPGIDLWLGRQIAIIYGLASA